MSVTPHHHAVECDFRYSNRVKLGVDDEQRTATALKGIVGKRLKYRSSYPQNMN